MFDDGRHSDYIINANLNVRVYAVFTQRNIFANKKCRVSGHRRDNKWIKENNHADPSVAVRY